MNRSSSTFISAKNHFTSSHGIFRTDVGSPLLKNYLHTKLRWAATQRRKVNPVGKQPPTQSMITDFYFLETSTFFAQDNS